MPERRRSRTMLAVLTLASLVLITVDYRQGDGGIVQAVQRGALAVFAPVQEGFSDVVRPIGGFFSSIGELASLRDRNAELEDQLADIQRRLPSVADLERENAELRALLDMRERLGYTTTGARVIGQPPGATSSSVLIDIGAEQGLEPGMAVLNADGLVGKLTEVTPSHARVELVTSPNAQYAIRIVGPREGGGGESGLLQGQGARPFQLEVLDPEAEVDQGAEVLTRTFQASTIPDGIPVGEISERAGGPETSSRFLSVRPYVDFTKLSLVQVVLDAPTQPAQLNRDDLVEDPDPPRPEGLESDESQDAGDPAATEDDGG